MANLKLIKRIGANLLIFIFLMIMIRTHLDRSSPLVYNIYKPITPIQNFFSFYQNWSMFSPNPSRVNAYVDAEIFFKSGKKITYSFLRPSRDELIRRYLFGERFRKYLAEGIRLDGHSRLWPATAEYIARDIKDEHPNEVIDRINLQRHWYNIPDWKENFIPFTKEANVPFQHFIFYTWEPKK